MLFQFALKSRALCGAGVGAGPRAECGNRLYGVRMFSAAPALGIPKGGRKGAGAANAGRLTVPRFKYSVTGTPVGDDEFRQGQLGGKILLDTNVLTPILDGRKLSVWFEAVLANNKNAVAQFSIAEYLCSQKARQSSYQAATQALRNKGIVKFVLEESRVDLALACEGHVRGYSFLTMDKTFCSHFQSSLTKWALTTYCVPKALLR
ncbi:hypothetical protein ABW21_db0200652 [Orbilia brochopaga]|nr:hypothetical protein ABW21_db0200652 [Drechslerella brochopaga]